MPMVELTTTKGVLDDAAKEQLAGELSAIVLELEAAPLADFSDVPHMQALSWCFVNEQDGMNTDEPGRLDRMRQAAMQSVGATTAKYG